MTNKPIKICFVGMHTYPVFNPNLPDIIGGAEVRSYLISTELAKYAGYEISYVVGDHNQPPKEVREGVTLYAHPAFPAMSVKKAPKGLYQTIRAYSLYGNKGRQSLEFFQQWLKKGIRFFYYPVGRLRRLIRIWRDKDKLQIYKHMFFSDCYKIYEQVDADIYCCFGVTVLAAQVAAFCQKKGKRSVLFIADDSNLDENYKPNAKGKNIYNTPYDLGFYVIDQADLIFTQTHYQAMRLKALFGKLSITVLNPILLETKLADVPDYSIRQIAFWIGRADNFKKKPLTLIQLAKLYPDVKFVMVMNPSMDEIELEVKQAKPANVRLYDHVPYDEIEKLFAQAFVFITTSSFEGFPNTFLQAGKYGVPILSLNVDPDGFIEKYGCGIVAHGDFEVFQQGLREIQADQQDQQRFSHNIRDYVKSHHDLTGIIEQYDTAFREFMQHNQET